MTHYSNLTVPPQEFAGTAHDVDLVLRTYKPSWEPGSADLNKQFAQVYLYLYLSIYPSIYYVYVLYIYVYMRVVVLAVIGIVVVEQVSERARVSEWEREADRTYFLVCLPYKQIATKLGLGGLQDLSPVTWVKEELSRDQVR